MDDSNENGAQEKLSSHTLDAIAEGKMMYWNDRESFLRNIGDHPIYGEAAAELMKDEQLWGEAMQIMNCLKAQDFKSTLCVLFGLGTAKGLVHLVNGKYYQELRPGPQKSQPES